MKPSILTVCKMSAMALAVTCIAIACKKNVANDTPPSPAQQAATVEQMKAAVNQTTFLNGVFNSNREHQGKARTGGRENSPTTLCPSFTTGIDSAGGWGITLGFDYGTGCPNDIALGIVRRGKVDYKYFISNSLVSTVSSRYTNYEDAFAKYNGLTKLSYQYIASGNQFLLSVDNLNVASPSAGTATYQAGLTYKQVQGAITPLNLTDDVYEITGTTSSSSSSGIITSTVLTPLINRGNCQWVVSGKLKIVANGVEGILDYGSGACDNIGTLTVFGISYVVYF